MLCLSSMRPPPAESLLWVHVLDLGYWVTHFNGGVGPVKTKSVERRTLCMDHMPAVRTKKWAAETTRIGERNDDGLDTLRRDVIQWVEKASCFE